MIEADAKGTKMAIPATKNYISSCYLNCDKLPENSTLYLPYPIPSTRTQHQLKCFHHRYLLMCIATLIFQDIVNI